MFGVAGISGHSLACRHIPAISASTLLPLSGFLCVSIWPYKDTTHTGFRSTLIQYDLNLHLQRPISKRGHIPRAQGFKLHPSGNTAEPTTDTFLHSRGECPCYCPSHPPHPFIFTFQEISSCYYPISSCLFDHSHQNENVL